MQVKITRKYIWFPVQKGAGREKVILTLSTDPMCQKDALQTQETSPQEMPPQEMPPQEMPQTLFEYDLPVVSERVDFYFALCVEEYIGETITISVDFPEDGIGDLLFEDEEPPLPRISHPLIHFSSPFGWINDPNGLIFDGGLFHMYYQHNPCDTKWGNMHWGHAVSADLTHWKKMETALCPDEYGTIFSGCAVADKDNLTGHGWNAIIYFYTAAGGTNRWSQNRKFTQRLAYSTDGGMTLKKDPDFELDTISRENRDPKVFYHAKSGAHIMVLFLEDNDFGIFRSTDLIKWDMTQKLTLEGAWECPDLFELPVEGTDQTCWVFTSADGFYFTGDFDGYRFLSHGIRQNAYIGTIPYAAQTFSGVTGRVLSVSWLRISPSGKPYSGIMSVPSVLSLSPSTAGVKLRNALPEEFTSRRFERARVDLSKAGVYAITQMGEQAYEITVALWCEGGSRISVLFAGHTIIVDCKTKMMNVDDREIPFEPCRVLDIDVLVDYDVIELRAQNDTIYYAYENTVSTLSGEITVDAANMCQGMVSVFEIQ